MIKLKVIKYLVLLGAIVSGVALCYVLLELLRIVEQPDFGLLANVMIYGAVLEEVLKFTVSLALFYKFRIYTIPLFVGFGFGLAERILYWSASGTLVMQDLGAIGMHTLAGIGMAYFFKKFLNSKQPKELLYALGTAILIHVIYNILIWIWYITALQQLK